MALFAAGSAASSAAGRLHSGVGGGGGMDVLVKRPREPEPLRSGALEATCAGILGALFRRHQKGAPSSSCRAAALAAAEQSLSAYTSSLPVGLREELLCLCLQKLDSSALSGTAAAAASLPVLAASLTEVLFSPHFSRLELSQHLQWHRDSRMRALHLLHSSSSPCSSLRTLELSCYRARIFRLESPLFSERFVLTSCFHRLPHLRRLSLPCVCDDEVLAFVSSCCPGLEELDVGGSFALTDQGIRLISERMIDFLAAA